MSGSTSTYYTARFLLPEYLVRGQDNPLTCAVYRDGALVAPDAVGTVYVYDESDALVASYTTTTTGSKSTATLLAAALPSTLTYGDGWRVEWHLRFGGFAHVFTNKAHLVRSWLHPVVTDADLFRRWPTLDPNSNGPLTSDTDFQAYLDEAWVSLVGWLSSQGRLPFLIIEPTALRECHLALTASLIFDSLAPGMPESNYGDLAERYRRDYTAARRNLRFEYDTARDGTGATTKKHAASATIWLV